MPKGINFVWDGSGFGNALILAHLTKICIDNGIPAVFTQHKKTVGLVDVPLYEEVKHKDYLRDTWKGVRNTYLRKNIDEPVLVQYIKHVEDIFGITIEIKPEHNHIPVKYYVIPETKSYDVVMWTQVSSWAPYRLWPYFDELKFLLDKEGITYVDMTANNIISIDCLNHVQRSKLYLGLETGTSHYVSEFANNKALILQSGFCPFSYWAYPYQYDYLKKEVDCKQRPCFITKKEMSQNITCSNMCMFKIEPETVIEEIKKRI